jgi:hypothetical protein
MTKVQHTVFSYCGDLNNFAEERLFYEDAILGILPSPPPTPTPTTINILVEEMVGGGGRGEELEYAVNKHGGCRLYLPATYGGGRITHIHIQ